MVDTDSTFLGTGSSYSPVSVSEGAESLGEMGKKPNPKSDLKRTWGPLAASIHQRWAEGSFPPR